MGSFSNLCVGEGVGFATAGNNSVTWFTDISVSSLRFRLASSSADSKSGVIKLESSESDIFGIRASGSGKTQQLS